MMWADYPQALHTEEMKSYYLVQLSFWTHMIFVTCIEVHRSDFAMMILHHCITSWLVATSCKRRSSSPRRCLQESHEKLLGTDMMNFVRIGVAIMVCFDFADIFLPLAKSLRYVRLNPLDDIAFALFALAWVPTRHFLMMS